MSKLCKVEDKSGFLEFNDVYKKSGLTKSDCIDELIFQNPFLEEVEEKKF